MVARQERDPAARTTQVGVDVGGTFTDLVAFDPVTGTVRVAKVPSTPGNQANGVMNGLVELSIDPSLLARFVHGTTVATNAVLERRGARTVLVVTEGFRDLLEIARQNRPRLYDLFADRPEPLVPRELVVEAPERVAVDGTIVKVLDESSAREVGRAVSALAPEAVAICLLYSFLEPGHEDAIAAEIGVATRDDDEDNRSSGVSAVSGVPGVSVSLSSRVLPVFREYERASTTALNAYVAPPMARYLGNLEARLRDGGLGTAVEVMRSGGGTFDAGAASKVPVHTLLSGPAAGAWGAAAVAGAADIAEVIAFDMGGTSTDVTLIEGGVPGRTAEGAIGGLPFGVATTDVHTIGAGGGSVAWPAGGGGRGAGPPPGGADPGPACYGRGGTEPTVTDALLALDLLDPDSPLGGSIRLRTDLAARAVGSLGKELGLDVPGCAEGIVRVAEAQIERALRVVSVERGKDPRRFALLPFGGAGPLLQGRLARALGCARVIVPASPGVLSAMGLLTAPFAVDLARTRLTDLSTDCADDLDGSWRDLEETAGTALADQGVATVRSARSADCRYSGQAFELEVPAHSADPRRIVAAFHAAHRERYGFDQREQPVELVTMRVRAEGPPPSFVMPDVAAGAGAGAARRGSRRAVLDGRATEIAVYAREALGAGDRVAGPALLVGIDSTCLVLPGQRGDVDPFGTLVLMEEDT
jgi:N-methylhydantoinase A